MTCLNVGGCTTEIMLCYQTDGHITGAGGGGGGAYKWGPYSLDFTVRVKTTETVTK